jgi:hypothetical protein
LNTLRYKYSAADGFSVVPQDEEAGAKVHENEVKILYVAPVVEASAVWRKVWLWVCACAVAPDTVNPVQY